MFRRTAHEARSFVSMGQCYHSRYVFCAVFRQPAIQPAFCSHFAVSADAREMKVEKRLFELPQIKARRRELSFTSVVGLNKYLKSITPRFERFSRIM